VTDPQLTAELLAEAEGSDINLLNDVFDALSTAPDVCVPAVAASAVKVIDATGGSVSAAVRTVFMMLGRCEASSRTHHLIEVLRAMVTKGGIPADIEAEQALRDAWEAFSAVFWGARGETREYVLRQLPGALASAQASVEAALGDLRHLQELNDVFDGAAVIHADENDPEVARARFERWDRGAAIATIAGGTDLGSQGRVYGLLELVGEYARALTPPPVEPEPEIEPETDEGAQERAWKQLKGVPVAGDESRLGIGRPARDWPA
jgi:hypothetical protein